MLLNRSKKNSKLKCSICQERKKNRIRKNILKSNFKNLKTSIYEDSINLGCVVFVLSKIAFLEGVFVFGSKINVSI